MGGFGAECEEPGDDGLRGVLEVEVDDVAAVADLLEAGDQAEPRFAGLAFAVERMAFPGVEERLTVVSGEDLWALGLVVFGEQGGKVEVPPRRPVGFVAGGFGRLVPVR